MPKTEHFHSPSTLCRAWILSGPVLLFLVLFSQGIGWAQVPNSANATGTVSDSRPEWIKPPDFKYASQDKPDPFRSFVQPETARSSEAQKNSKPSRPLTPLERVRPTQLNLVGILLNNNGQKTKSMAMVELPNGKGYILRPGTRIGRSDGQVVSIEPGKVTIQEKITDIFGEKKTNKVVLKLHKASGESNDS